MSVFHQATHVSSGVGRNVALAQRNVSCFNLLLFHCPSFYDMKSLLLLPFLRCLVCLIYVDLRTFSGLCAYFTFDMLLDTDDELVSRKRFGH